MGRKWREKKVRAVRPPVRGVAERNALVVAWLSESPWLIPWAARRAWRRLGDGVRAQYGIEDAEADATLGLIRAAELWDGRDGVKPQTYCVYWVTKFVQRGAAAAYRPTKRYFDDSVPSRHEGPAEAAARAEEAALVRDALANLPPRYAEVLRLRSGGLTLAEVGERLGCTRENVRMAELRAVDKLLNHLCPSVG